MRLELRSISRNFSGHVEVRALDEVSLTIHPGEFLAIVGPSGGGKSTLLNTIGLLDLPDGGTYLVDGHDTASLTEGQRARLRSIAFGFVFQGFHLLDSRPAIDSVELGLLYRAVPATQRLLRARESLAAVGLDGIADQRASHLSGGQRQRVAIARALASSARVIVADEPTGNLDSVNGAQVMKALRSLQEDGCTIVLVTHDSALAATADRIAHLRDGRIHLVEDLTRRRPPTDADSTPLPLDEKPSRLRMGDAVRDAFRTVRSRPARTIGLVGAVATAVALAIATLGISGSAAAQVSDRFDRHTNRDVTISRDAEQPAADALLDDAHRILESTTPISGATASAVVYHRGTTEIQATSERRSLQAPAVSVVGQFREATRSTIRWAPRHEHRLADGEVLLGASLARQLPLGTLDAAPMVDIGGEDVVVAGIVDSAPRDPSLLGAVITGGQSSPALADPDSSQVLLRTSPGAAQQVARQAPIAVDPTNPTALRVSAPIDPTTLRSEIESDVQTTLLAFTGVAVAAAIVALGNSMVLAVLERRSEFGLRRAIGARSVHIASMVITESAIIGALGGLAGLLIGFSAVSVMTLLQRWSPIFDPALAPLAVIGGIVVGSLGGLVAAWQAIRIEPQEALRS